MALAPSAPSAKPAPATDAHGRPRYEQVRLKRVLEAHDWTLAKGAEGKVVGEIHVVRHDVFVDDEIVPTFLNIFHGITIEDVIRQEVLLDGDAPYSEVAALETARNLRRLGIFAFVQVVPIASEEPGVVDVLIFTRDLWSLRIEASFQITDGLLNSLRASLIERNLAGRNMRAAITFELSPKSWSIGEQFYHYRLAGKSLSLSQSFDLIFRRSDTRLEGGRGLLAFGRPLYSLEQAWGWAVSGRGEISVHRQLSGSEVLTWNDPATPQDDKIPRVWDRRIGVVDLGGTRQAGAHYKHRIRFGGALSISRFEPNPETMLPKESEAAFRREVLPPSRDQVYPYAGYEFFEPRYDQFIDLSTYAMTEDVRVGPRFVASVGLPLEAFGSSSDSLFYSATAAWVFSPGDALLEISARGSGRLENNAVIDQLYDLKLRGSSPAFLLGRIVWRVRAEFLVNDTRNTLVSLGGDNGLRGYPTQAFYVFGGNRLRFNLEWRTPALVWKFIHVGAVVFYDAGSVYKAATDFQLRHNLGFGFRAMLPQFNQHPFRLDIGFPLDGSGVTVLLTFGNAQAVPLTPADDARIAN